MTGLSNDPNAAALEHRHVAGHVAASTTRFDDEDLAVAELDRALTRVSGLRPEHDREWTQFACWAVANEHRVLPASAQVLLAYLAAYPGTLTTQRGRATAVAAAHRVARRESGDPQPVPSTRTVFGLPSPAEAESVRRVLRPQRAERLAGHRARVEAVLPHLPITGWPDALTARRDAIILHLAAAGLSWDAIAGLRQRDVILGDTVVIVGSQPLVELTASGLPITCPVAVTRRWATVLAHAPRATGHIELERLLTAPDDVTEPIHQLLAHWTDQPLLTRFDGRGLADGVVDELDPLTSAEVAEIVATRMAFDIPVTTSDLDPDYYERGLAARARAREISDDLDELFARLDAIADPLLDLSRESMRRQGLSPE
ncbi:hypothetical protein [Nocardia alba]|uniref:Uncharacterized protein n=1 Tax=Nocardia alba TaxID=225051 RepID=A0A4R1FB18_9NOCA|nr:hypothetical protein [Nocardia alba]TCJ90012.1 hypothetical protein DFR71_6305 [Nocardia alba]